MKKIILLSMALIVLVACEDFELENPQASFRILKEVGLNEYEETSTFALGEELLIENTSSGEIFTIFTGDDGHDGVSTTYADDNGVEKMNIGFDLNHPRENVYFRYSYSEAGTYTIKVIAITSYGEGNDIRQDFTTKEITVTES